MKVGQAASLQGLQSHQDLNGQRVTLQRWSDAKQRWTVTLDNGGEVNVRPENLTQGKGETQRQEAAAAPCSPSPKRRGARAGVRGGAPIIVEDTTPKKVEPEPSLSPKRSRIRQKSSEPPEMSPQGSPSPKRSRITAKASEKTVEQIYQKKSQLEHILLRPDSYVGSVERQHQELWSLVDSDRRMERRALSFVPALYKIFDEILVNAADNLIRDPSMDSISVDINVEKSQVSVWNNGRGLPIEMHKEHRCYVPELVFGHLLTSDNYDDAEKKVVGGRNGYGAKLTNIYSKLFVVETVDSGQKKRYRQIWRENMRKREEPTISQYESQDYTSVTFEPDFPRFGMRSLEPDIVALMRRRTFDVAVALTDGSGFQQVSFVNSICTSRGGTHVNYVADQIVGRVMEEVGRQKAGNLSVKPAHVRSYLWVFVNCLIENPAFDSQTKETLTTKKERFGSTCELSEELLQAVLGSGLVESLQEWSKAMGQSELARHLNKSEMGSQKRLFGVPKLEDANQAGTKNSQDCTLIITEGDSAKALAVAGLSVVGRDHYGVFPLRGKLRNVRELSVKQMMDNKEIESLMKIMALDASKKYQDTKGLRYGSLMIMTDQDFDGSHIKGLVINFIQHWFPGLLRCDGFLREFVTPIVKVAKGSEVRTFFTVSEYESWKRINGDGKGWTAKYYKGLGTSTSAEAREYFSDLQQHELTFLPSDQDGELIDMAFNAKRADARKEWISNCTGEVVDHSQPVLTLDDFVNKELVLWAKYDVERAIPSMVDGLKPGQRKVLYSAFLKKLNQEIKVAQFSGFVAEKSAYHHGETSLQGTIIGMAQNFVGSNNLNLLQPLGQFGTRGAGGKDHAAPRYIFTRLTAAARKVFCAEDDPVLEPQTEEGQPIEPKWYCPVLPMILVNGAEGIGVGWSTSVPNYSPRELIANVRRLLRGEELQPLTPWYRGYKGAISQLSEGRYESLGVAVRRGMCRVEITELPIRRWTQDYKEWLLEQMQSENSKRGLLSEFREYHTENSVLFSLSMLPEKFALAEQRGIEKTLRLKSSIACTNMYLFDAKGKLKKYESPEEILRDFAEVRLGMYEKRKAHRMGQLMAEAAVLSEKARFIRLILDGQLQVEDRANAQVCADMRQLGLRTKQELEAGEDEEMPRKRRKLKEERVDLAGSEGYAYLLKLKLWSLTEEKVAKLMQQLELQRRQLDELKATTLQQLWERDLVKLEEALDAVEAEEQKEQREAQKMSRKAGRFEDDNSVNRQCVLVLSDNFSHIKRIRTDRWKGVRKGGRGKTIARKKESEKVEEEEEPAAISAAFACREFDALLAFTCQGNVFMMQALDVPLMQQNKNVAVPLAQLAPSLPKGDSVAAVISVPQALKDCDSEFVVVVTRQGLAKRIALGSFKLRSGKLSAACPLEGKDELRWVHRCTERDLLLVASAKGHALCFPVQNLRPTTLKAKCQPAMKLKSSDQVGGAAICRVDVDLGFSEKKKPHRLSGYALWMQETGCTFREAGRWKELPAEEREKWQQKAALGRDTERRSANDKDDDSEEAPEGPIEAPQKPPPEPAKPAAVAVMEGAGAEVAEEDSSEEQSPRSPKALDSTTEKFLAGQSLLLVTRAGFGKRVPLSEVKLRARNRMGPQAIKLVGEDSVTAVGVLGSDELPKLPRKPPKPADLFLEQRLAATAGAENGDAEAGQVQFEDLSESEQAPFVRQSQAEELAYEEAAQALKEATSELREKLGEVLLCTSSGSVLRIQATQVPLQKRRHMGRCLMKVEASDSLTSASLLSAVDEEKDECAAHSEECDGEDQDADT
ncbi:unnamed protein product [Effrenium voratum]|uniref:DNA topoisomerase 2 n=1 Tax=Effrenium voratum TaxID=2562239 RepID=A0AA36I7T4_9DINO|nr:unnamed protein product [Effrenium voratum]